MKNAISFVREEIPRLLLSPVFLCLFIASMPGGASAQNSGKLSGSVKDAVTGEALIGCNITILGTKSGASTEGDGTYFVLNIPAGRYEVQATMIGYQRVLQQNVIINSGKTTVINFKLNSTAFEQQTVVIQATRPDVEKEKTSTSTIIRADDIQGLAGMRDVSDVIGLAADVSDGHFRGGRDGEELYTLQGMGLVNPLNSNTAFVPIMSAVEEVEVITSGFGAQFGNAQSGVVNITMKEGRTDRWRTTAEVRTRMPARKHFGPNVYDPENNPALKVFLSDSAWLKGTDPDNPTSYFGSFGIKDVLGSDTTAKLAAVKAIWREQTKRDLYMKYGENMDYSVEASAGGPINEKMRMFLAFRSDLKWPTFPTDDPDIQRQIMGNIVSDIGPGMTLRLVGGYQLERQNVFPSYSGLGFYNWMFDRITSINYDRNENFQLGLKFSHALSQSTFYEIKLNSLSTHDRTGSGVAPSSIADSLLNFRVNQIKWSYNLIGSSGSPELFAYMVGRSNFSNEKTQTFSFDGSITSQVTNSHLINGGIQFNTFNINVKNINKTKTDSGSEILEYTAHPYELGLYVQDKMEFEGMIANVGLRLDLWNTNTSAYTNVFSPFRKTIDTAKGYIERNGQIRDTLYTYTYYDNVNTDKEKAPIVARLQPRIGISFPVYENTVFHANYGTFMQRPAFQYSVSERVVQGSNKPVYLGNPKLEPQYTNSYDVGVTQGLGEGFTLDVSGYYKDVKNLIETAQFNSVSGLSYVSYFNRDNADIRGFRVQLNKRKGMLTGSATYHYSVAFGKSATSDFATPVFTEDTSGNITTNSQKVPSRDALLNFDRTHNLILNVSFNTDDSWGPRVFGILPFSDMSVSASSFARSGRPYTSPSNPKLFNGARTPAEYNTNLKITKRVRNFFGVNSVWYCEVFNLFDNKILNYNYIFAPPSAISPSTVASRYELYGLDDPVRGIRYWNENNIPVNDFPVEQLFMLYSNLPRAINFGVTLEL